MNTERIKEIQQATAYPESVSVQQALLQVWNETEQSNNANVLLGAVNNLKLVGSNKGFNVYFNANDQTYTVFKDGKFVIGNKYRFTDVKCYLD
jgi:hypothetical protein